MEFSLRDNWIHLPTESKNIVDRMEPFARHALFHKCCQSLFQAETGGTSNRDNPILTQGFSTVQGLLDESAIGNARAIIDDALGAESSAFEPSSEEPLYSVTWTQEAKIKAADIIRQAFSGSLSDALYDYYGSHFFIRTISAGRLFSSTESRYSYLWHRDMEVPQQLHVIIYLTDLSETGGGTQLLPVEDTRLAAQAGYDFPNSNERKSELHEEFEKMDRKFSPCQIQAKAGDALVFAPNRVLHRGYQPTEGFRDAILCVVLPCPSPWSVTFEHNYQQIFLKGHPRNYESDPFAHFERKGADGSLPDWIREFRMEPENWQSSIQG